MKRVAKSLLLSAGIIGVVYVAIVLALVTFASFYGSLAGISLTISGYAEMASFNPEYMSESTYQSFFTMMIVGISLIVVGNIAACILSIGLVGLLIACLLTIVCAGALDDKKAGYIISLVFGILTLLSSFLLIGLVGGFIGLLMMVGAILGMVALKKEKSQFKAVR